MEYWLERIASCMRTVISDIPRVNQPSLDRMKQLNSEWAVLKSRGNQILNTDIPAFNKALWDAGVGAIWKDS